MSAERLVCEAWVQSHANAAKARLSQFFHIRPSDKSGRTLCEMHVANGTYIPLAHWGTEDSKWCPTCEKRRKPMIAVAREKALVRSAAAAAAESAAVMD
jgi:hypothetical protein